MQMSKNNQEQNSGNASTNLQARRDIHFHGITYSDAREIALDVFKSNALELAGIAKEVALNRVNDFTDEFLTFLHTANPDKVSKLADPDMQYVLFEAQKEYARAGEEDLKTALVNLLNERANQDGRDLRTIALNEAISSVPKLTENQRRAIAWVFYLRHTRIISATTTDDYFSVLGGAVNALGTNVSDRRADYQHIEYVGAGTISFSPINLGSAIRFGSEGLFTNGFPRSEIKEELLEDLEEAGLIKSCPRNRENIQIDFLAEEDLPKIVREAGLEDRLDEIEPLITLGSLPDTEVLKEATDRLPSLSELEKIWNSNKTGLQNLTLTSVGLALGHAYWTRLTGNLSPLSIWL